MQPFTALSAVVFAVFALVHLWRFIRKWPIVINGRAVPVWISPLVVVALLVLAVMLWREGRI